jgi:cytochrome d ubiquinol oxidase subunit I
MSFGQTAELLARIQFGFTVSFHFIFPAFSIGLASFLAVLNALWLWKRDAAYLKLFDYWKAVFAIVFGMGVVSGIVMSYQFGTNWARFSDRAGPVIGPLMGYEVLTAFFLEAGFLGIALFGRKRVGDGLHMLAVTMVALGTLISATWILAANSWMQTPAGYAINAAGQFVPVDWWAIIFNPSFPYRLVHTVLNSLEHQPAKIAAIEGHYQTTPTTPLILLGIPDDTAQETKYAIEIPYLGGVILAHDPNASIKGLKDFPPDQRPAAFIPFFTFRIMVGLGLLMLALGLWSLWARYRRTLYTSRWLLRAALVMGPSGFVAVLAGWYTTEVGRQPFTVYGLLRTSDSLSNIDAAGVGASLVAFVIVYFAVFGAGVFYILRTVSRAPEGEQEELHDGPTRAAGITPIQQIEAGGSNA